MNLRNTWGRSWLLWKPGPVTSAWVWMPTTSDEGGVGWWRWISPDANSYLVNGDSENIITQQKTPFQPRDMENDCHGYCSVWAATIFLCLHRGKHGIHESRLPTDGRPSVPIIWTPNTPLEALFLEAQATRNTWWEHGSFLSFPQFQPSIMGFHMFFSLGLISPKAIAMYTILNLWFYPLVN